MLILSCINVLYNCLKTSLQTPSSYPDVFCRELLRNAKCSFCNRDIFVTTLLIITVRNTLFYVIIWGSHCDTQDINWDAQSTSTQRGKCPRTKNWAVFSRESDSTITNVCSSVCLLSKPLNSLKSSSFIIHHFSFILHSTFIILHSSFLHFATFKLFSLLQYFYFWTAACFND